MFKGIVELHLEETLLTWDEVCHELGIKLPLMKPD